MAHKLDPMDLKQIISLHLDGLSNRKIAGLLGIGRNTVNTYMRHFKGCERPLGELIQLDNSELEKLFPMHSTIDNARYERLMHYFEQVNQARNHPGFTFQHHYEEYRQREPEGYSYTQFMEHYHRQFDQVKGSMKLEHEAGKELFIDFAGKKLHITDRETYEQCPVEVFISLLPCSQYTYVEACETQQRKDLIGCMAGSLAYFGGVPKAIVPDNLKSAVTRASKYESDINRSFKEFARHYGCVINPTRSYAPQDKALVENAVQLAYQRIYYPLRQMTFFSLKELNCEIRKLLEVYNDQLFQRKGASRRELFQSVERQYLKALPPTAYELKDYRRAKVQKMGYVYFSPDKNYYSVPYRYIGKSTQIHYTQSAVEVYYNHQRIAFHQRSRSRGHYITNKDHLSSTHQAYTQWSPEYFERQAVKHGEWVGRLVRGLFAKGDYPEINYKRAMGIIQLHKSYGNQRLDRACQRAVEAEIFSYRRLKNILANNQDQQVEVLDHLDENQSHIPRHNNVRGAKHYQ